MNATALRFGRTERRRLERRVGTRRRRLVGWLAGIAVVIVIGAVAFPHARARLWPTTYEAPERADLPPVAEADATQTYLAGPGRPVVQLRTITTELTDDADPNPATCAAIMTERFPELGSPQDVATAIAQIPDQATAEMAWSYLDALRRWLPGCADGAPEPRDELRFRGVILDRRLAEVG